MNSPQLTWLIIGGGIHGVHLAATLLEHKLVTQTGLRILDPGDELLASWQRCTAVTGMRYLRSPAVHHIDLNPWSLQRFAGKPQRRQRRFAPPYDRPSLELFNEHCAHVIHRYSLDKLHIRDRAISVELDADGAHVMTAKGQALKSAHVLLAIGASEEPDIPDWATPYPEHIQHAFDPELQHERFARALVMAVIGGGITAAQLAIKHAAEGTRVHLISRHPLREHQFDSDPGWLGPKLMSGFERERDLDKRRALITQARHRGSMPPDVSRALQQHIKHGLITFHQGHITAVTRDEHDGLNLALDDGQRIHVERALLATGFKRHRPGGSMLDALINHAKLPCARCGYPVLDHNLRWHPRLAVCGPLAELELGPASRNIAGARRAAARITGRSA